MVNVIGNYNSISRARSGLFSFDVALGSRGEFGVPLRTIIELYGYTNTGKSTLAYFLAGKLTGKGDVDICDLENADTAYIKTAMENADLDGDVHIMDSVDDKGKPIPHEEMLGNLAVSFSENTSGACILDSVGGITPIAEMEGDFGEAFMGKRAKLVAQVSRAMASSVRNKERPSVGIVINHVHSVMGGRGHTTAGGETLKYLAAARVMIWPSETITLSEDDPKPIGFYVRGKTEKFRYGGRGKEFGYYIVPDYGVHVGASAMFDCFALGLAERSSTVKMEGKSYGYLKKDLLTYAYEGKQRKFDPFVERLQEYEKEQLRKMDSFEFKAEETVEDMGNGMGEVTEEKSRKRKGK